MSFSHRARTGSTPSNFYAFTPGSVKPLGSRDGGGARNVGPRVALTTHIGNMTIGAGQTVSGLDIHGKVTFTGNGTLRDCRVRGTGGGMGDRLTDSLSSGDGLVNGNSYNMQGSLIEWCQIDAAGSESAWLDGVRGGNFTMRYCEIARTCDGIGMVQVGNATVEACRINDGYYTAWLNSSTARPGDVPPYEGDPYPGFPAQSDKHNHSDGIQIHQFDGWVIRGCYIGGNRVVSNGTTITANRDPAIPSQLAVIEQIDSGLEFANAAILVASSAPTVNPTGAMIEKNWFAGGATRINLVSKVDDTLSGVTLRDNRFEIGAGYYIYMQQLCQATMSNNVYDTTGLPVPVNTYA